MKSQLKYILEEEGIPAAVGSRPGHSPAEGGSPEEGSPAADSTYSQAD
jgi:hypothetical protein